MHRRGLGSGFPVQRTRVSGGAGDEEAFETKASPPAVAGPLRSQHKPDHRRAQSGDGPAAAGAPEGILLDLLTGTHGLRESLDRLAAATVQAVSKATGLQIECGVVVHQPKRNPAITGTSDEVVELLEHEQDFEEGPLYEVLAGGHPVAVLQRNADFRWPRYSTHLQMAGFGSAMGLRLRLGHGAAGTDGAGNHTPDGEAGARGTAAGLALFAQDAKAFPLQVIAEARTFAGLAAKSLDIAIDLHTARSMAADLRSALDSRTSINVACGVIMGQNRCSYQEAFSILAKASSHRNIKVRQVAEDILERLPEGPPRAHFGH